MDGTDLHKSNYNFNKDLVLGHEGEERVLAVVKKLFPQAYRMEGYAPEFDIVIPEINKTIEVKNDMRASDTGNLAIECYKKSGDPSGLMASKADFWVYIIGDEMLMMGRELFKQWLGTQSFRVCYGGDRNSVQLILAPLTEVRKQPFVRALDAANLT